MMPSAVVFLLQLLLFCHTGNNSSGGAWPTRQLCVNTQPAQV